MNQPSPEGHTPAEALKQPAATEVVVGGSSEFKIMMKKGEGVVIPNGSGMDSASVYGLDGALTPMVEIGMMASKANVEAADSDSRLLISKIEIDGADALHVSVLGVDGRAVESLVADHAASHKLVVGRQGFSYEGGEKVRLESLLTTPNSALLSREQVSIELTPSGDVKVANLSGHTAISTEHMKPAPAGVEQDNFDDDETVKGSVLDRIVGSDETITMTKEEMNEMVEGLKAAAAEQKAQSEAAPEAEPAQEVEETTPEAETNFMTLDELIAGASLDELMSGQEIEGADPEMVEAVKSRLAKAELKLAEAMKENELNLAAGDLMESARELMNQEAALQDEDRLMFNAMEYLSDVSRVISGGNSAQVNQLLREIHDRTPVDAMFAEGNEENLRDILDKTNVLLEEADQRVHDAVMEAEEPGGEQVREAFEQAWADSGGSLDGLEGSISDQYPQSVVNRQAIEAVGSAHEMTRNTLNMIDGIDAKNRYALIKQRLEAEAGYGAQGIELINGVSRDAMSLLNDISREVVSLINDLDHARSMMANLVRETANL